MPWVFVGMGHRHCPGYTADDSRGSALSPEPRDALWTCLLLCTLAARQVPFIQSAIVCALSLRESGRHRDARGRWQGGRYTCFEFTQCGPKKESHVIV